MADTKADREFGLDDAALAVHPTVYGPEAYRGKTVLISGGAGGILTELCADREIAEASPSTSSSGSRMRRILERRLNRHGVVNERVIR